VDRADSSGNLRQVKAPYISVPKPHSVGDLTLPQIEIF
jgi:hypothetical protein